MDGVCAGPNTPETSLPCDEAFDQDGGNEGGDFLINVGNNGGKFLFKVNTFDVADTITLYDGDTGAVIGTTGCLSTDPEPPKEPLERVHVTPSGLVLDCQDGECEVYVPFGGTSVRAVITPLCAGGLDTDWEITIGCKIR